MRITDVSQLDLNGHYTISDYLAWQFQERVELIKGKIFKISPGPSTNHQHISRELSVIFYTILKNYPCKFFVAPYDVFLGSNNKTVVQPDLIVVCDNNKIKAHGCVGAPDLIVEILSKGNTKKEIDYKFNLYQEEEVQEYWIIHPETRTLSISVLKDGKYFTLNPLTDGMMAHSKVFSLLNFDVSLLFAGMIDE